MEVKEIRELRADEIECRVSTINERGLSLLLYKDARVDMKILDETFSPLGWKRTHQLIGESLFCTVEVYDSEKKEWISKQDVGSIGSVEKEKGQASDAFKRACTNIGIGRELYTAPFIWVSAGKANITKKNDKCFCNDRFRVKDIAYGKQREITGLTIINDNGQIVYEMNACSGDETQDKDAISKAHISKLTSELKRTGIALDTVLDRYGISNIEEFTEPLYEKAMEALKKSKPKAA